MDKTNPFTQFDTNKGQKKIPFKIPSTSPAQINYHEESIYSEKWPSQLDTQSYEMPIPYPGNDLIHFNLPQGQRRTPKLPRQETPPEIKMEVENVNPELEKKLKEERIREARENCKLFRHVSYQRDVAVYVICHHCKQDIRTDKEWVKCIDCRKKDIHSHCTKYSGYFTKGERKDWICSQCNIYRQPNQSNSRR